MQGFSFARPLETWSGVHRLCVAGAVALFTFVISTHFCAAAKVANIAVRRSLIEQLAAHVQAASATAAALPALRQRVAELNTHRSSNALADNQNVLPLLTAMTTASNLRLEAFEPGQTTVERHWRERRLQLLVTGSFANLLHFAAQLAALPYPMVPVAAQLSAQKYAADKDKDKETMLSLKLSLRAICVNDNDQVKHKRLLPNLVHEQKLLEKIHSPFDPQNAILTPTRAMTLVPTALPLRLVGILQQGSKRVALIQSSTGFSLLHRGDRFEGQTVMRIDRTSLLLSGDSQTSQARTLLLQEAKP